MNPILGAIRFKLLDTHNNNCHRLIVLLKLVVNNAGEYHFALIKIARTLNLLTSPYLRQRQPVPTFIRN